MSDNVLDKMLFLRTYFAKKQMRHVVSAVKLIFDFLAATMLFINIFDTNCCRRLTTISLMYVLIPGLIPGSRINPLMHDFYFQGKRWIVLLLRTSGD